MVCLGLGAGLVGIYGFFVEPLSREFGVGAATINMGSVFLLLVPGLVGPLVGKLVDRVPIRHVILAGSTLAMASLVAISQAPSLALIALGFIGFSLGLSMYGPVVINAMLVKLYPAREARALAIAAMGISVASASLPPVMGLLMAALDWRLALALLAVSLAGLLWLVILAAIPASAGAAEASPTAAPLARSIYRDRNFWQIGVGVALSFNAAIVLAVCYPPHFSSQGYSLAEAGWFIALSGLAGLTGKLIVAGFADRAGGSARWLAAGLLLCQALGMVLLALGPSLGVLLVALCLLGFGGGGFIPMHPYLNSRYFDASMIGRINGAQMPLFLPLGLIGPPLAGYIFDLQGHYLTVMGALSVVLVVAATVLALLPPSARGGAAAP